MQRLLLYHPHEAAVLLDTLGSAEAVYEQRHNLRDAIPDIGDALVRLVDTSWERALARAEQELAWCERKDIRAMAYGTAAYPSRLMGMADAPQVLYFKGAADLEAPRTLAIVGTRRSTDYSRDVISHLMADIAATLPGTLVISGLAYGVDITAHREALANGLPTVACLAHGLDTLYPAAHRHEAIEMLKAGGLATEYQSETRIDRSSFLARNRIIAGLADCCIVAESMEHGGSLVTARLATDYGREVFAIPGRVTDKASEGCNRLILAGAAHPLLSAADLIHTMGWEAQQQADTMRRQGIQTQLFHDFTAEQKQLVDALRSADQSRNALCQICTMPINRVSAELLTLEMMGVVREKAGGMYHLIT